MQCGLSLITKTIVKAKENSRKGWFNPGQAKRAVWFNNAVGNTLWKVIDIRITLLKHQAVRRTPYNQIKNGTLNQRFNL